MVGTWIKLSHQQEKKIRRSLLKIDRKPVFDEVYKVDGYTFSKKFGESMREKYQVTIKTENNALFVVTIDSNVLDVNLNKFNCKLIGLTKIESGEDGVEQYIFETPAYLITLYHKDPYFGLYLLEFTNVLTNETVSFMEEMTFRQIQIFLMSIGVYFK